MVTIVGNFYTNEDEVIEFICSSTNCNNVLYIINGVPEECPDCTA